MAILEADNRLDALIDGETPFASLPATLPHLAERTALCHLVTYHNEESHHVQGSGA